MQNMPLTTVIQTNIWMNQLIKTINQYLKTISSLKGTHTVYISQTFKLIIFAWAYTCNFLTQGFMVNAFWIARYLTHENLQNKHWPCTPVLPVNPGGPTGPLGPGMPPGPATYYNSVSFFIQLKLHEWCTSVSRLLIDYLKALIMVCTNSQVVLIPILIISKVSV